MDADVPRWVVLERGVSVEGTGGVRSLLDAAVLASLSHMETDSCGNVTEFHPLQESSTPGVSSPAQDSPSRPARLGCFLFSIIQFNKTRSEDESHMFTSAGN